MQNLSLATQVYMLLGLSTFVAAAGAMMSKSLESAGAFWTFVILYIVGGVSMPYIADSSASTGLTIVLYLSWVLVSGLLIGPAVGMVTARNGWRPVTLAFLTTTGILVGCSYASVGLNVEPMVKPILMGTLIFLGVSIIGLFIGMGGKLWDIVTGLIGATLASGFILIDSARLMAQNHVSEVSLKLVVKLSVSLWADIVWLFIELLKLYSAVQK